jgi:hypothetical protein
MAATGSNGRLTDAGGRRRRIAREGQVQPPRLMCWVAIERAIRLAIRRGLPARLDRWRKARDAIYRRIMDRGWSPRLKASPNTKAAMS